MNKYVLGITLGALVGLTPVDQASAKRKVEKVEYKGDPSFSKVLGAMKVAMTRLGYTVKVDEAAGTVFGTKIVLKPSKDDGMQHEVVSVPNVKVVDGKIVQLKEEPKPQIVDRITYSMVAYVYSKIGRPGYTIRAHAVVGANVGKGSPGIPAKNTDRSVKENFFRFYQQELSSLEKPSKDSLDDKRD